MIYNGSYLQGDGGEIVFPTLPTTSIVVYRSSLAWTQGGNHVKWFIIYMYNIFLIQ